MKILLAWLLVIVLFLAGIFGLNYFGWWQYNFFAPKMEQTRYNTFKQSQAYNEGQIRQLSNYMAQYQSATADQKAALKELILQQFEVYDISKLPSNLQNFYNSLQGVN